ncbi:MAG: glycosyltransferase [Prevotellaceae bacterium]|nr:glycosyltransferase [Prevotellaceae bacterium]
MKRVMHVAEPFATGVLSFLVDVTRRQVDDYEIYILYGVRPLTPKNVERLFDSRIHLIRMPSFKGALGTVVNPKAYIDVYRMYKEIKPDVVHLHSSAAGFVGRWALPCGRQPVFYTPHGFSFLAGNGPALKRALYKTLERVSAMRPARTVACSKGEYEEALRLPGTPTYVNNGINTEELEPYVRPSGKTAGPVRVCTSGRILPQKNPSLFNRIAESLPGMRFTWIGEGDMRNLLTAPNIEVTGWVSRDRALGILGESDFFILPSLWEGLPISLLEAMYMKKVCLVSDIAGNRDVIRNGENGFVCDTAEEYADRIRAVADGKIDGQALAARASLDVARNYNADLMAKRYKAIYEGRTLND